VQLPPQCTSWRFLASLHLGIARQLLTVKWRMRERVWAAANMHLDEVTVDTDTTVHTLFGNQMGGRKSYTPKNNGKKSYHLQTRRLAEEIQLPAAHRLQRTAPRSLSPDKSRQRYPLYNTVVLDFVNSKRPQPK
jgi:hypothetical protein